MSYLLLLKDIIIVEDNMYDFKVGKDRIISRLNTEINISEDHEWLLDKNDYISQDKSIRTFVSVISVNLKKSRELFKMNEKDILSKLMKVFLSEIIQILSELDIKRDMNIIDDTVYAIYATPTKDDVYNVARLTFTINTFMRMINKLLDEKNLPKIAVGIGMGTSYDTLIEVKQKGTRFNKVIPVGSAMSDALNLSKISNQMDSDESIGFNEIAYINFIDQLVSENEDAKSWFIQKEDNYYASIIYTNFEDYIKNL
jgi:hypothetical protein